MVNLVDSGLEKLLAQARRVSWRHFGKRLDIFLPGMFTAYGRRGRHPAVSITGSECALGCEHCGGRLLEHMLPAQTPEELVSLGQRLWQERQTGLLLSGGSDVKGSLPWRKMLPAIDQLKKTTGLVLTAHVARIDEETARLLKLAGVRQALLDVVGDEDTAREILHLGDGLAAQTESLAACQAVGLEIVPHLILGLHYGSWRGEEQALELVAQLNPSQVVFVVFMPLKGTPMAQTKPLPPPEVARFLAKARQIMPRAKHSLGCARPRGRHRREMDRLAVRAGINALALPSDAAEQAARELELEIRHFDTCCSLAEISC